MRERGTSKEDEVIFRFTVLEIATFYSLYQLAHKWKNTKIFINGNLVKYSPDVTKVFRCCYEASDWPQKQNDWYKKNGRPEKNLEIKHYCYGYARTVHNIVGCQKIKAARDKRLLPDQQPNRFSAEYKTAREGWMNDRFIRIKDGGFEVDIEALKNEIFKEFNNGPNLCPYIVKERIDYALDVLEQSTKATNDFWSIEDGGTLNPKPIEYYFEIEYNKTIGSQFKVDNSLAYFIVLSKILDLSLYETVKLIAIENPGIGFTFHPFGHKKTYVKFESIDQLSQRLKLLLAG